MKYNFYSPFGYFLFRTPLLPCQCKDKMDEVVDDPYFDEALFLASPDFYTEKKKGREKQSVKQSLYKYYSRSFSRCTPFGLFAGCSVGRFGEKTEFKLGPMREYTRRTRLDMNYLCALIQHIESDCDIKYKLTYFTNDSIYNLGGKMRYIEYYYKGIKRIHNIIGVERNEFIDKILERGKEGATINELAAVVVDNEITLEEAKDFIEELIASQLLKSELEAGVTGNDTLEKLTGQLERIGDVNFLPTLCSIRKMLDVIDSSIIGESLQHYDEIIKLVEKIGVKYELQYLFQTDMYKPTIHATLSEDIANESSDFFVFLDNITPTHENESIIRFKEVFCDRFGEEEVSLAEVMDCELGLGYPIESTSSGDMNPLVDDLVLPVAGNTNQSIRHSNFANLLLEKYMSSIRNEQNSIVLEEKDFGQITERKESNMPQTIALMCNIIRDNKNDDYKVFVKNIGGSSAANLMGRFCHIDSEILNLTKSITEKEQNCCNNAILAEIVHLPESRIGNIALRPQLREYEIKYLTSSSVDKEHQITISDIMVSVHQNRIVLRSKRLNKEIVPHLTNAHNYSFNSMPAYHFLCDLQSQGTKKSLWFSWSGLFDTFDYLPRIEYKNFILSLQKWRIKKDEIKEYDKLSDEELLIQFSNLREKYRIPREVTLNQGDNELYIDLECPISIRTMLSSVKKHPRLQLSEFILGEYTSPVKDGDNNIFNNEFIIPFYRNVKQ